MDKPNLSIEIVSAITDTSGMASLGDGRTKWYMPKDLKRFRELTTNTKSTMAIAAATFDAMRTNGYPLFRHRHNVVIGEYDPKIAALKNHDTAVDIAAAADLAIKNGSETMFLVGDADFYRASFEKVKKLHLTVVQGEHTTNDHFPNFDDSFELIYEGSEETEDSGIAHVFKQYIRR